MSLFLTSFIFEKKEYDEEFYQLDGWIERYTQTIDGYIGMESYTDAASGRMVNNYYWQTRESMELLINNLQHQQAKSQSHKWLSGYQTIIAEIQGAITLTCPIRWHHFQFLMRDAIVYVLNVGALQEDACAPALPVIRFSVQGRC